MQVLVIPVTVQPEPVTVSGVDELKLITPEIVQLLTRAFTTELPLPS